MGIFTPMNIITSARIIFYSITRILPVLAMIPIILNSIMTILSLPSIILHYIQVFK